MEKINKWWHVAVTYDSITDEGKGKPKKNKEEHLVRAVSPTDLEVIITKDLNKAGINDFEYTVLKPTKIIKILTSDGEIAAE